MTTSEWFHLLRFYLFRSHLFLSFNFSMKLNDLTPIWVLCLAETNNNQLLCSLDPSTWYHYQCNFFLFHFINQLLSIFNFIAQDILLCRRWTSVSPSGVTSRTGLSKCKFAINTCPTLHRVSSDVPGWPADRHLLCLKTNGFHKEFFCKI